MIYELMIRSVQALTATECTVGFGWYADKVLKEVFYLRLPNDPWADPAKAEKALLDLYPIIAAQKKIEKPKPTPIEDTDIAGWDVVDDGTGKLTEEKKAKPVTVAIDYVPPVIDTTPLPEPVPEPEPIAEELVSP